MTTCRGRRSSVLFGNNSGEKKKNQQLKSLWELQGSCALAAGSDAPLVTAQTPSVTVQIITQTVTLKQQVSPRRQSRRTFRSRYSLPVQCRNKSQLNTIRTKSQRHFLGFGFLFFFPEQVILKIKPCEWNCRAHVTAVWGCGVEGGRSKPGPGSLIWLFSTSLSLSTSYLPVL